MCTPINPANAICDNCKKSYLRGHHPGDLTFEQVEACEDLAVLTYWAGRCDSDAPYPSVPQLCPADRAGLKAWRMLHPDIEYDEVNDGKEADQEGSPEGTPQQADRQGSGTRTQLPANQEGSVVGCAETNAGLPCVNVQPNHAIDGLNTTHVAYTEDPSLVKLWGRQNGVLFTRIASIERERENGRLPVMRYPYPDAEAGDLIRFREPPRKAETIHLYHDSESSGGAAYIDGKLWVGGEFTDVLQATVHQFGGTITKVDGADLWVDPNGSEWDPHALEVSILDPEMRRAGEIRAQISQLQAELAELENGGNGE